MSRLAVAPFTGEHGDEIAGQLESRLWGEDTYSVADRSELGPAILAAGFPRAEVDDPERLLNAASHAGIDGIILGEVLEYGVFTAGSHSAEAGAWSALAAPDRGSPVRAARVELSLRLMDAQTGAVVASRHIRRESPLGARVGWPHSEKQLLQDLSQECLEEFMGVLAPQTATAEIHLAAGEWYRPASRELRRGIRLARQGRWEEAQVLWEKILARDPVNHAALFDLAVAAGQRQDFAAAEEYAMRALREHHTECYTQGLDQLRQFRSDSDRIARQRQAQVIQASLAVWQD